MDNAKLAHRMREEHDKVNDLVYLVRKHFAVPPRDGLDAWITEARAVLRRLTDHLQRHFALEESGGYMQEVLERRPELEEQVGRLRREHGQLCRLMSDIERSLSELTPADALLIRHCVSRIGVFLSYVAAHEENENHIVLCVFTQDLGTKD